MEEQGQGEPLIDHRYWITEIHVGLDFKLRRTRRVIVCTGVHKYSYGFGDDTYHYVHYVFKSYSSKLSPRRFMISIKNYPVYNNPDASPGDISMHIISYKGPPLKSYNYYGKQFSGSGRSIGKGLTIR